jgi:hypothetical protein
VYLGGRKVAVILAHAAAGWVLCFATIGIVHAIGAVVALVILGSLDTVANPVGYLAPRSD